MGKNQHVTPHSNGGYQVKGAGNQKATKLFDRQSDAINFARDVARNQQAELVIHNQQGRIRAKDSYGRDTFPPRG